MTMRLIYAAFIMVCGITGVVWASTTDRRSAPTPAVFQLAIACACGASIGRSASDLLNELDR